MSWRLSKARTIPVSVISSSAMSAEDALLYLQKTMPLEAMRSVLQYCKSRVEAIFCCTAETCVSFACSNASSAGAQPLNLHLDSSCVSCLRNDQEEP